MTAKPFLKLKTTEEAWAALAGHYEAHGRDFDLREAFARDPGRFAALGVEAPEIYADLSKNLWDLATHKLLIELADSGPSAEIGGALQQVLQRAAQLFGEADAALKAGTVRLV